MSERKIIINDIDIADCKFWKGYCRIGFLCDYAGHICEVKSDCYYKQLKRKEQTLNAILELVEENKNTCQYQGICKSILGIIKQAKENNQ